VGGWRRLHNVELHNLYVSSDITKLMKSRMRWAVHVARMRYVRNSYKILVGNYEGRSPIGRRRRRREI